uniref:Uncharacterized protein n=1 Tax=Macaca nemestrina TaxID=9545 RepID=A0A2K6BJQ1_MACNE
VRMYSLDAHESPPSPSPWQRQDSAAGNSREREPGDLGRASGVGSSNRPTVCMGRQQGLPFCTVCGYLCSSSEGTRGRCAVGKARVAEGGGAPGGGAGMRCCGSPRGGRVGSLGGRNRGAWSLRAAGSRGTQGGERPQSALPAHCRVSHSLCSGPPLSPGLQAVSILARWILCDFIYSESGSTNEHSGRKGVFGGVERFPSRRPPEGPLKGDLKPSFQLGHPFLFLSLELF